MGKYGPPMKRFAVPPVPISFHRCEVKENEIVGSFFLPFAGTILRGSIYSPTDSFTASFRVMLPEGDLFYEISIPVLANTVTQISMGTLDVVMGAIVQIKAAEDTQNVYASFCFVPNAQDLVLAEMNMETLEVAYVSF